MAAAATRANETARLRAKRKPGSPEIPAWQAIVEWLFPVGATAR